MIDLFFFCKPLSAAVQMKKGLKDWNFEGRSRIRSSSGNTIGDDLCAPIPRDIKAPGLEVSHNRLLLDFLLSFLATFIIRVCAN